MSHDRTKCFRCHQPLEPGKVHCTHCGLYEPWREPPSRSTQIASLFFISFAGLCLIIFAIKLLNQPGPREPGVKLALLILGVLIMFLGFIGGVTVLKTPPPTLLIPPQPPEPPPPPPAP